MVIYTMFLHCYQNRTNRSIRLSTLKSPAAVPAALTVSASDLLASNSTIIAADGTPGDPLANQTSTSRVKVQKTGSLKSSGSPTSSLASGGKMMSASIMTEGETARGPSIRHHPEQEAPLDWAQTLMEATHLGLPSMRPTQLVRSLDALVTLGIKPYDLWLRQGGEGPIENASCNSLLHLASPFWRFKFLKLITCLHRNSSNQTLRSKSPPRLLLVLTVSDCMLSLASSLSTLPRQGYGAPHLVLEPRRVIGRSRGPRDAAEVSLADEAGA